MKIFIAVPTYETISPDTFKSIYGLERMGHLCVFDFIRGYDCATARNRIARQTIDEKADYVLMVDNDVVLPSDALINFLDQRVEVCLGYYPRRNHWNTFDGSSCLFKLGEYDYTMNFNFTTSELFNLRNEGKFRIQIHGGGMGCAFIKADVFNKIAYPWFKWVNYDNGTSLSEDLYFCEECRKAGIPIYTDTRIKCGHMFRHIQWCE